MSGGYAASPEDLIKLAGQISDVQGMLRGEVSNLDGINDSLKGGWEGAAAKAFSDLLVTLHGIATNIHDDLGKISEHIQVTGKNYGSSEDAVHTHLSKIRSTLG